MSATRRKFHFIQRAEGKIRVKYGIMGVLGRLLWAQVEKDWRQARRAANQPAGTLLQEHRER